VCHLHFNSPLNLNLSISLCILRWWSLVMRTHYVKKSDIRYEMTWIWAYK
jgi:hypothetical protein